MRFLRQIGLVLLFAMGFTASFAGGASAIDIQEVTSPGGVKAWLVESHANPLIAVAIGFKGGSAADPADRQGLSELMSGLMDEGAGDIPSAQFQQQLADHGIRFGFEPSSDHYTGSLQFLTEDQALAFDLLHLSLTKLRFDAEPIARMKGQFESMIRQAETDPNEIAGRALNRLLFADHPYGRPGSGTVASMEAITVADLQGFVSRTFTRDKLYVAVVGDITPAQLQPLLDKAFGDLPAKGTPLDIPEAKVDTAGGTVVIDQDIPQSIVLFAQNGIKRDDPDFFPAYVANFALGGGGFSSRLMNEVREKRGLAYGISSDLSTYDHAGLIAGGVQTVNAKVGQVVDILKAEWGKMQSEGPTAEELETAKTYLLGYYPRNFTTTAAAARTLLGIQLSNLGIDYVTRREQEIAAVTLDDAKRVAKRLFDPAKLAVVVVGKPVGVKATRDTPSGVVPATQP